MPVTRRLYLFAGGGTGGHLFPGIAVAECLLEHEPDARILFVGSERLIERDILAMTAFEQRVLPSVSLSGVWRKPLRFFSRSWSAYREAKQFLEDLQPAAVIGCGGFASAAPVAAALRRRIPCVLLEQNLIPGRATCWLSRWGGIVCVSFEESRSHLPRHSKSVMTGNPVRRGVIGLAAETGERPPGPRKLVVLGGSQGARSVNDRMLEFARDHREALQGWKITHQAGAADEARVRETYGRHALDALVTSFFNDPVNLYRGADLAVSRAGATTLAELACAGVPAILLPYPHAAADHQWHNAEAFRKAGAALVVNDGDDRPDDQRRFHECLEPLLTDAAARYEMSKAMQSLAHPDAAAKVCDVVRALVVGHDACSKGRTRR